MEPSRRAATLRTYNVAGAATFARRSGCMEPFETTTMPVQIDQCTLGFSRLVGRIIVDLFHGGTRYHDLRGSSCVARDSKGLSTFFACACCRVYLFRDDSDEKSVDKVGVEFLFTTTIGLEFGEASLALTGPQFYSSPAVLKDGMHSYSNALRHRRRIRHALASSLVGQFFNIPVNYLVSPCFPHYLTRWPRNMDACSHHAWK